MFGGLGSILLGLSLINGLTLLISYVVNNSFKKPLSAEETIMYFKRYQAGDKEAFNILVEHNLRLVAHIGKKYKETTNESYDDLISIGTIGLIKAINTFDVERSKFSTYASRCIHNEILMCLRSKQKDNVLVSLEQPVGWDQEGNELTWSNCLGTDPEAVYEEVENIQELARLKEALAMLPVKERTVLIQRYGLNGQEPQCQREIAKDMGISRSYVSRIETKGLRKLVQLMATSC
ncbi:RNA polymerase sporulation sigma factor SigK [Desulfofalx alkaliphila]|uniref:RNA polymerase sporulation sigma factor SigK n=1 Tax=Desulfofalx alkaliphila TaxID=105483 RepID=UPI0004E190B6|nr:RNA polymerase sporulation sigma factor SigK [Desulfofalx alkaliphila]